MNKKIRNLIIGGIVLVLLVGVLLLLKFLPSGENPGGDSSSETSYTSESVQLFKKDKDDIASLEVENAEGGFTILRQAEGVYTIEALEGFDQLTSSYSTLVGNFASVSAMRMVEEAPGDLSKYGLSSPKTQVTVTYKDGTKNVLHIGDNLPTGNGRYAMLNDDAPVYALGSTVSGSLENTVLDYVSTTVIDAWTAPVSEDDSSSVAKTSPDIKRINIVGGSLTERLGDIPLTIVMGEDNEGMAQLGASTSTWRITSPVNASVHTENTSAMMEAITNGVTATKVAAINPTEDQLAYFGFTEPYAKVEFTRDNDDFALTVGNYADGSSHYVMLEGRNVVYVVSDDSLPWITVDINKVFSSLTVLPYIDNVEEIEVSVDGKTYLFKTEGEDDDLTATVNGNAISTDNYRKIYQYLLSAPAEEINFDKETGPEIARITYRYRDVDQEEVVRFLKVSDRRCVLSVNGEESFLTRTVYLDRLAQNMELILNDEKPVMDY